MAQITRDKILEVTLALLDSEGEAFSMRRLGKALNVDAKAIYYYYPNKNSLLNATLKYAIQELQVPDVGLATWQEELTALAHTYSKLAETHPNIVPMMLRLDGTMPAAFDLMEPVVEILARTRLPERYILQVVELFVSFLPSYMIEDGTEHLDDDGLLAHLQTLSTEQYPAINKVISTLQPSDLQIDSDTQIKIIIWGIEKLIANVTHSEDKTMTS
ncbi:MAG: TetR/AcrR family transcriptional regulator C-terminal domain-containing protein [Chloroflexota bacterium]